MYDDNYLKYNRPDSQNMEVDINVKNNESFQTESSKKNSLIVSLLSFNWLYMKMLKLIKSFNLIWIELKHFILNFQFSILNIIWDLFFILASSIK